MNKKKSIEEIKADYHLFVDIQMGKYFKLKNKSEFSNEEEAKKILGAIVEAYNKNIAANHVRLDNSDKTAKVSWFNSIEIDFESDKRNQKSNKKKELSEEKYERAPEAIIDKELDLIPYCYTVLSTLGYKFERMREIISGEQPSEIESELIQWSFKIVRLVNKAVHIKSASKAVDILDEAYYLLLEKMDKPDAKRTLSNLHDFILSDFNKKKRKK
jgi:hypothetical protein